MFLFFEVVSDLLDLVAFGFSVFGGLQVEWLRAILAEVVVRASHAFDAVPARKQELRDFFEGDVTIGVSIEDFFGEFVALGHEPILLHFLFRVKKNISFFGKLLQKNLPNRPRYCLPWWGLKRVGPSRRARVCFSEKFSLSHHSFPSSCFPPMNLHFLGMDVD